MYGSIIIAAIAQNILFINSVLSGIISKGYFKLTELGLRYYICNIISIM